jgi:hypothetical protein
MYDININFLKNHRRIDKQTLLLTQNMEMAISSKQFKTTPLKTMHIFISLKTMHFLLMPRRNNARDHCSCDRKKRRTVSK